MQVYLGTFLLAFAMLALEITLTRLLSVTTWYHLAFFAIATAMLGMTAGATLVYLKPKRFTKEKLHKNLAQACVRFALAVPVALVILCLTPLVLVNSIMAVFGVLLATAVCALPFYFAGIAITLIVTKYPLPIGRLYAADLVGASFGCLFVLGGLEVFDAPSLILLCGALGASAAFVFAWRRVPARPTAWYGALCVFMVLGALANASSPRMIRPLVAKGHLRPAHMYDLEKWNSFSRITVDGPVWGAPFLWGGGGRGRPTSPVLQRDMQIDGEAGTTLAQFRAPRDIDYLRYAVTNMAYHLRPRGGACVIGVGGGRDLQSALLFGHEHVTGIDVNPIFVKLLQEDFREFAGLADRDDVTFVVDEARSHLSRSQEQYSVLQMSLIDTWAATGAGAFSLSENSLYTIEAWKVFFDRLGDDGIFTVSRWYSPKNLGETGRLISLAVASLLASGVEDPSRHIALVTQNTVSTLLLSRRPFASADLRRMEQVCQKYDFQIAIRPDQAPQHATLREIVTARSLDQLREVAKDKPLRCDPPTDEDPYFFNMLRLGHLETMRERVPGAIMGNIKATLTLVGLVASLTVLALATIVAPLVLRRKDRELAAQAGRVLWAGALYFSLIGAGFMLVEIALIQKLSVLLSHPVYALGILLFTMILSTGVGSLLSERLPLTRAPWTYVYPLLAVAAIFAVRGLLSVLLAGMITSPMWAKILVSVAVVFPMGMVLGLFFPTGMRLVRSIRETETPWYWALNGVFGVLASAVAVFFSIFFGVSTNFYVAAACYGLVLLCVWDLHRQRPVETKVISARITLDGPSAGEPLPAQVGRLLEMTQTG